MTNEEFRALGWEITHGRKPTPRELRLSKPPRWVYPTSKRHGRRETARERKRRMREAWWLQVRKAH